MNRGGHFFTFQVFILFIGQVYQPNFGIHDFGGHRFICRSRTSHYRVFSTSRRWEGTPWCRSGTRLGRLCRFSQGMLDQDRKRENEDVTEGDGLRVGGMSRPCEGCGVRVYERATGSLRTPTSVHQRIRRP